MRSGWPSKTLLRVVLVTLGYAFAHAQAPNFLERLQSLPQLNGKVPTFYTAGHRERAQELQSRIEDMNQFFQQRLGVHADVTLALLGADDWKLVTGRPYGLPNVRGKPAVIFMPATRDNPAYSLIASRKDAISADTLSAFLVKRHTTFDAVTAEFVDLIGFHELGHRLTGSLGIDLPNAWLGELVASFWSYAYISERQPEWKAVFDLFGQPSHTRPKITSLQDFERLYDKVDDYTWYQGMFEARIREMFPVPGLKFLTDLKPAFPDSRTAMDPEQVLRRLEKIAPGFQKWAAGFAPAAPLRTPQ